MNISCIHAILRLTAHQTTPKPPCLYFLQLDFCTRPFAIAHHIPQETADKSSRTILLSQETIRVMARLEYISAHVRQVSGRSGRIASRQNATGAHGKIFSPCVDKRCLNPPIYSRDGKIFFRNWFAFSEKSTPYIVG
jgi:hypothetical protein